MADREKVIKGLECLSSAEVCNDSDCPYYDFDCTQKIAYDALELLKEQKPRVYTYDEVNKLNDNLIEVVWFEAHNFVYITPMLTRNTNFENESSDWFKYGHDWRCWSARPTEEQREAVKWDE